MLKNKLSRDDPTLELERHLCSREVPIRGADVVEQTAEVVCLGVVRPLREMLAYKGGAYGGRS